MASGLHTVWKGLAVSDGLIAKALRISEVAQIARTEQRMREFLLASWERHVAKAVRVGAKMARDGVRSEKRIERKVADIMGEWVEDVAPVVDDEVRKMYRLARIAGWRKASKQTTASLSYDTPNFHELQKADPGFDLEVLPSFDVVDSQAAAALAGQQRFWIGNHYNQNLSDSIAGTVKGAMVEGGQRAAVVGGLVHDGLEKSLMTVSTPAGWHGSAAQYFEGLAANSATVARVHGQIESFSRIGITRYEIVNPRDERTCPSCSLMDGKVFTVSQAQTIMANELAADSKDAYKAAHPWLKPAQLAGMTKPGFVSDKDSADLAAKGFAIPPFHFR